MITSEANEDGHEDEVYDIVFLSDLMKYLFYFRCNFCKYFIKCILEIFCYNICVFATNN